MGARGYPTLERFLATMKQKMPVNKLNALIELLDGWNEMGIELREKEIDGTIEYELGSALRCTFLF